MKKVMIKIDSKILELLTQHIRKWIKKNDFKKHKIDFLIQEEAISFKLTLFITIVPFIIYLYEGTMIAASFHIVIWGALCGFKYIGSIKTKSQMKPIHDLLFSLRKNPEYYEMEKLALEEAFESGKKHRIERNIFTFVITVLFSSMILVLPSLSNKLFAFFLLCDFCLNTLEIYTLYVFDFDEPEGKKKAKVGLSEIVLRAWQNLIGGLVPKPM